MVKVKSYCNLALSSLLAGIFIALGATVYLFLLSAGQKLAGSLLFALGLFTVITFSLWLYTGKVGFVLDNKGEYLIKLFVCLVFNLLGSAGFSKLVGLTRYGAVLSATAQPLVQAKQGDSWYSIFILSILCGVMIYLAVRGYKDCPIPFGKILFVFLSVSVFILCGFEHVVANASYYAYAGVMDGKTVLWFFIMAIGNGIGSILFDGALKLLSAKP